MLKASVHCPLQQCNQAPTLQHLPRTCPQAQRCAVPCLASSSWGTLPPSSLALQKHKRDQKQKFCFFLKECQKPYVSQQGRETTAEHARHHGSHPPPLRLNGKHPVRNAFCIWAFLEIIICKRRRLILLGACDSLSVFGDVLAGRVVMVKAHQTESTVSAELQPQAC